MNLKKYIQIKIRQIRFKEDFEISQERCLLSDLFSQCVNDDTIRHKLQTVAKMFMKLGKISFRIIQEAIAIAIAHYIA